jgi:hypothetical protein
LDLPDELLVKIIEDTQILRGKQKVNQSSEHYGRRKYDNTAVLDLAQVCRKLSGIAQDMLFRNLHVEGSQWDKLPSLAACLSSKPHLAEKVRTMTFNKEHSLDYSPVFLNSAKAELQQFNLDRQQDGILYRDLNFRREL